MSSLSRARVRVSRDMGRAEEAIAFQVFDCDLILNSSLQLKKIWISIPLSVISSVVDDLSQSERCGVGLGVHSVAALCVLE